MVINRTTRGSFISAGACSCNKKRTVKIYHRCQNVTAAVDRRQCVRARETMCCANRERGTIHPVDAIQVLAELCANVGRHWHIIQPALCRDLGLTTEKQHRSVVIYHPGPINIPSDRQKILCWTLPPPPPRRS